MCFWTECSLPIGSERLYIPHSLKIRMYLDLDIFQPPFDFFSVSFSSKLRFQDRSMVYNYEFIQDTYTFL